MQTNNQNINLKIKYIKVFNNFKITNKKNVRADLYIK